jgi:hypothetical protein
MTLHGPYISEPKTPARVTLQQLASASSYELFGPFFAGWVAAAGPRAVVSDGGEVYQYRTADDFQVSYDWRKTGIASDTTASAFIPPELRPRWRVEVDVAFGTYDRTWKPQFPMSPDIMRTTLANALRRADRYVWYYTEGDDWWGDGKRPPQAWVDAIRAARAAAGLPD